MKAITNSQWQYIIKCIVCFVAKRILQIQLSWMRHVTFEIYGQLWFHAQSMLILIEIFDFIITILFRIQYMKFAHFLFLMSLSVGSTYGSLDASNTYINQLKFFNVFLGLLSSMSCMFLIGVFFSYKQGRKSPGDIILALATSFFMIAIYWMASGFYVIQHDHIPDKTGSFCKTMIVFNTFGIGGQFCYNCAYCLTLRYAITNVLKVNKKFKILVHAVCAALIITFYVLITTYDNYRVDNFGMCSISVGTLSIMGIITLEFFYIFTALYTIWFFYLNIPDFPSLKEHKNKVFVKYVFYLISTVIMFLCIGIANVGIAIFQEKGQSDAILFVWIMIGNLATFAGPIILVGSRLKNRKIYRRLLESFPCFRIEPDDSRNTQDKENLMAGEENNFKNLQDKIRELQIKTILTGIIQYFQQQHLATALLPPIALDSIHKIQAPINSSATSSQEPLLKKMSNPFSIAGSISLTSEQINSHQQMYQMKEFLKGLGLTNQSLNQEYTFPVSVEHEVNDENTSQSQLSVLAPIFFYELMKINNIEINASYSFDLRNNSEQIRKQAGPDGGKSGEFFFFTHDNKWILKTLTPEELDVFRRMFPAYIQHMCIHRNSLINKIYGIFSIDLDINQTRYSNKEDGVIHLMLMRNLAQIPGRYIMRTFDLKGSEYARETLKKGKTQSNLSKMTLKDKDFDNVQGTLNVDEYIAKQVKLQMMHDVLFFKKQELMDYSLLVMIIDWDQYLEDKQGEEDESAIQRAALNELNMCKDVSIRSDNKKNVYFHFSIIDYFQKWNLQKITEKTTKQFITLNPHLDTSAQNPEFYAERFKQNVIEKIFPRTDEANLDE